jgi:hypothetical protein
MANGRRVCGRKRLCYWAIAGCLALFACEGNRPQTAGSGSAASDSAARVDSTVQQPDSLLRGFDPGATQVGDTVLGLRVMSRDARRAFDDSVWVGSFVFSGQLELRGVHQGHFDYPEVNAHCFHVTDSASVARVPRFAADSHSTRMKTWFCFTNQERARELLGSPAEPREATIVVDRYTAQRHFSDTWDSAELVRVISLGNRAGHTLRDPL